MPNAFPDDTMEATGLGFAALANIEGRRIGKEKTRLVKDLNFESNRAVDLVKKECWILLLQMTHNVFGTNAILHLFDPSPFSSDLSNLTTLQVTPKLKTEAQIST